MRRMRLDAGLFVIFDHFPAEFAPDLLGRRRRFMLGRAAAHEIADCLLGWLGRLRHGGLECGAAMQKARAWRAFGSS